MTRTHLRWVLVSVLALYGAAIALGVFLRVPFDAQETHYYKTYKDLLPLTIAMPAAYLAFAFQRRSSYLQALRALWSHMVGAVSGALMYTEVPKPTQEQYLQTLGKLSVAIEEVRGVYKNVPAPGAPDGWYPFEPVKQIYQAIHELGFGDGLTADQRLATRERIYKMWKENRVRLLAEFDRDKPTYHHAEYAALGPQRGASAPVDAG